MSEANHVHLSKSLSWLLRHGAEKAKLNISSDGFVAVDDILKHQNFKRFSVEDVRKVVEVNDKKRFSLRDRDGVLEIKANQGHSLRCVSDLTLIPIITPNIEVIHGTYFKSWKQIQAIGLSRMNRNHIHFATGLPHDNTVISGMRTSAQIYIYINLELALQDNIKFFKSPNGVILSPGNEKGIIEPKYFLKVISSTGQNLI